MDDKVLVKDHSMHHSIIQTGKDFWTLLIQLPPQSRVKFKIASVSLGPHLLGKFLKEEVSIAVLVTWLQLLTSW